MRKLAKKSKLQLNRETIHRLVPEEATEQVVGGVKCTKADTTCLSCLSNCNSCICTTV